jgi:hypothetical protein
MVAVLALAGAMLAASAVTRAADHPNFTGNWQADNKASDFGPIGAPERVVMNVTHKEPEVTIHSEFVLNGTSRTWDATCKTDGKECKSTNGDVTLSLQWEGAALILNRASSFGGMSLKIKETWSLSPDGKTLTSARALTTDQGNLDQKIIFTKP